MGVAKGKVLRTFKVPGLEHDEGRAVLEVDGEAVVAVDVKDGSGTLTTDVGGPARSVHGFDSRDTLDALVEGKLHPIVASLQGRMTGQAGDQRFALCVLLALRASAPRFAQGRA
jgi:hypothetical protein